MQDKGNEKDKIGRATERQNTAHCLQKLVYKVIAGREI